MEIQTNIYLSSRCPCGAMCKGSVLTYSTRQRETLIYTSTNIKKQETVSVFLHRLIEHAFFCCYIIKMCFSYDLDTTILQVQSSCGMSVTGKSTAVIEHQSFTNHHSPSNKQVCYVVVSVPVQRVYGNIILFWRIFKNL